MVPRVHFGVLHRQNPTLGQVEIFASDNRRKLFTIKMFRFSHQTRAKVLVFPRHYKEKRAKLPAAEGCGWRVFSGNSYRGTQATGGPDAFCPGFCELFACSA